MARNQGLIDFNAFLGGVQGAQNLNRQNQLTENQIFRENRDIMEMLRTDEEKRIQRDAGRYVSSIPLNRISAVSRDQSGMSSADHAIAQLRAIEDDPYFQQNTPEFQNQVLNSLAESAAVQMQQYLKSGEVNELAKLAQAFGQVDPLAQGTRAAARGASQTEAEAINRQWGTSLQVDPEGNVMVGDINAPAHVVLPAAARGGYAEAVNKAREWAQAQQGIDVQQNDADVNRVYQALALQQMGVDPSVLEGLGLTPVPMLPSVQPSAQPTVGPLSQLPMSVPQGGVPASTPLTIDGTTPASTPVVPSNTPPTEVPGVSANIPEGIDPTLGQHLNSLTLQDVQNMGLNELLTVLRVLDPAAAAEVMQQVSPSFSPTEMRQLGSNPYGNTTLPQPEQLAINAVIQRLGL